MLKKGWAMGWRYLVGEIRAVRSRVGRSSVMPARATAVASVASPVASVAAAISAAVMTMTGTQCSTIVACSAAGTLTSG